MVVRTLFFGCVDVGYWLVGRQIEVGWVLDFDFVDVGFRLFGWMLDFGCLEVGFWLCGRLI